MRAEGASQAGSVRRCAHVATQLRKKMRAKDCATTTLAPARMYAFHHTGRCLRLRGQPAAEPQPLAASSGHRGRSPHWAETLTRVHGGTAQCNTVLQGGAAIWPLCPSKGGAPSTHACRVSRACQNTAREAACIAASPEAPSDTGACSLDDPQPKFSPPMMTG